MPVTQPFIDCQAYDVRNSAYVTFPTQSDALLASLQLFHDVPHPIMDLVFSVITHPDFDTSQITVGSSADIIDIEEEARVKNRMAVMHERSMNSDGIVEQAGLPQFVLEQVLDIIDTDRIYFIKHMFNQDLDPKDMYGDSLPTWSLDNENKTLSNMSLVHRSWTLPAQKALGRSLYIGRPLHEMKSLYQPSLDKSILGPWTTLIAVDLYHPVAKKWEGEGEGECGYYECDSDGSEQYVCNSGHYEYEYDSEDEDAYRPVSENLHRLLVGFDNLKCFIIRSHTYFFTDWLNSILAVVISRNPRLEELVLLAVWGRFDLDPLIKSNIQSNLQTLVIKGGWISSDEAQLEAYRMHEGGFPSLRNLKIKPEQFRSGDDLAFAFLSILATKSSTHLESLSIFQRPLYSNDTWDACLTNKLFTPERCITLFGHLRALQIEYTSFHWMELIGPYCANLRYLTIKIPYSDWSHFTNAIPRAIQNLDFELTDIRYMSDLDWSSWSEEILELPKSERFSHTQSLNLHLGVSSFAFDSKVDELHEKMTSICLEAGIEYK